MLRARLKAEVDGVAKKMNADVVIGRRLEDLLLELGDKVVGQGKTRMAVLAEMIWDGLLEGDAKMAKVFVPMIMRAYEERERGKFEEGGRRFIEWLVANPEKIGQVEKEVEEMMRVLNIGGEG